MTRKRKIGFAAVLLAGIGGVLWLMAGRHIGLPNGSVKVASVSTWDEPSTRSAPEPPRKFYFWTTKGDLLRLRQSRDGSTDVLRDHLTPLNTLQSDTMPPVPIPKGGAFLKSTPDGTGLLYWKANAAHIHDMDVHFLSADGKSDRLLPALYMMNATWMPDGKHWIVTRVDGDYLNSMDGAPFRKFETEAISPDAPYVLGVNQQSHAIATLGNEWFEAPNPAYHTPGVNYPNTALMEFDPEAPSGSLKQWNVHAPTHCIRGQILLSPNADRILWIVEKQTSLVTLWYDRIRLGNNKLLLGDQAIYVSRIDGSDMRELFSASTEKRKTGTYVTVRRPLSDIRWLPDGKRISFVYKDDLYLAPVNWLLHRGCVSGNDFGLPSY